MEAQEWERVVAALNRDVAGIIRAQRVRREIEDVLDERSDSPFEEDRIFEAAFGKDFSRPRELVVDGVPIQVQILHRRGLDQSDVKGADLLYEIRGRKFVLVQYKDANSRDRVEVNSAQLDLLVDSCPNPCPPSRLSLWPTCGSWYNVKGASDEVFMPACRAKDIFGSAKSRSFSQFENGVPPEVFQGLFARCWIGARLTVSELVLASWFAFEEDRVLFLVSQVGGFGRSSEA